MPREGFKRDLPISRSYDWLSRSGPAQATPRELSRTIMIRVHDSGLTVEAGDVAKWLIALPNWHDLDKK